MTQRFVDFLHRYERDVIPHLLRHKRSVRMTIVVATVEGASEQQKKDAAETVATVKSFERDNENCDVTTVVTKREFYNKGADLHEAILKVRDFCILLTYFRLKKIKLLELF